MEEQQQGCSPSDCAGCAHADSCGSKPEDMKEPANPFSHINKVLSLIHILEVSLPEIIPQKGIDDGRKKGGKKGCICFLQ